MKNFLRKLICLVLVLMILFGENTAVIHAADTSDPVILKLGKEKIVNMTLDKAVIVCKTTLKKVGKIKVDFSADKFGTNMVMELYRTGTSANYTSGELEYTYKRSNKQVAGSYTTKDYLPIGDYTIKLYAKDAIKSDKKIKVKASCVEGGFADKERNNSEETAQPIKLDDSKSYKMLLSNKYIAGATNEYDKADYMSFSMKGKKKLQIKLSLKNAVEGVQLSVKQQKSNGSKNIKTVQVTGKSLNTSVDLEKKGKYYVVVEYTGNEEIQIPYTIIVK